MAVYIVLLFLLPLLLFAIKYAYVVLTRPGSKVSGIPYESKAILTLPASKLAKKLQNGELKSEQIVRAYVARIKEVNGLINAVVEERFEVALNEARQVDKQLEELSDDERQDLFDTKVFHVGIYSKNPALRQCGFQF